MILIRSNQRNLLYCGIFVFFVLLQGCSSMTKEIKEEQGAQAGMPNWTVQVLQASRSEDLECFYDDPDLTRIERYGPEGTKWVRVTVAVTRPASSNSLPVNQINLDGRPLLAVAYTAKPSHCAAFKFVSAFDTDDTDPKESKKQEKGLPKNYSLVPANAIVSKVRSETGIYAMSAPISVKNFKPFKTEVSGVWATLWIIIEKDKGKRKTEIGGVRYFEGAVLEKEILRMVRGKDTNEIALEFREKGLFGKRPSTKIILLFTAPAEAKDLQLNFGEGVLPVHLME